jgi:hypothetical protein
LSMIPITNTLLLSKLIFSPNIFLEQR